MNRPPAVLVLREWTLAFHGNLNMSFLYCLSWNSDLTILVLITHHIVSTGYRIVIRGFLTICTPVGHSLRKLTVFCYYRSNFDNDGLYTERRARKYERETIGIVLLNSYSGRQGMRATVFLPLYGPVRLRGNLNESHDHRY